MELTLRKTIVKNYKLQPYGKFVIKWKTRKAYLPNVIPFYELEIHHNTTMPMSEEQEKEIVKLMKKNQTDILTDGSYFGFYTRLNDGLVLVSHPKLIKYTEDNTFKELVDKGYSFGNRK